MRLAISVVLLLSCAFAASAADPPVSVIRVTATYPGADARTVDETVLAPLFQQLNGIEGASRIESEARNDGTGTVTVFFEPKADLNLAQVMVRNRAEVAIPRLPAPCRELGMPIRKLPAGPPAFWLALTSADDKYDAAFLENFATIRLKNELARVPGVADVRVGSGGEFGVRVGLNPDRLRAYNLTAGDVIGALRRQNVRGAAGAVGGLGLRYTVTASGRLAGVDQFENVVLKANPNGEILRLKDVARVELGSAAAGGFGRVDGKPTALIAVAAWPGRVTAAQLLKIEGADDLPPGMRFDVVADRAADRLLEVELRVPPGSSMEYTESKVAQATDLIRGLPGKPGIVATVEDREPTAATILVKLPAKGGPSAADVEKALDVITNAQIRAGGVPPGGEAFPVRLALTDPGEQGERLLGEVAERVVAGLARDRGVAAPLAFPGPAVPHYELNVDRDKCATLGVELDDVFTTLQTFLGGVHATDFSRFGRTWRVTVQTEPRFARHLEDLEQQWVRNNRGEMVPLAKVAAARKAQVPPAVVRVNGYRAVVITAAPVAGKTPAETAARCVNQAREVLPKGYYVKDLTGPPR